MRGSLEGFSDDAELVQAARDLLIRTAELPGTMRELLLVLSEYRHALHALVVEPGPSRRATAAP